MCLQHKYYASIASTSQQNSKNSSYLSASFKKRQVSKKLPTKSNFFRSDFIAAVTFCIALYFLNFPRFPQVLKNSSFNLGSLGANPAKHLSRGITPLHIIYVSVLQEEDFNSYMKQWRPTKKPIHQRRVWGWPWEKQRDKNPANFN